MNNRSALVIGGGIAGLAAALELARNKVSTTVIEAKPRFGGRIHTIHDRSAPIELGAEFVHGQNKQLLKAIRDANLITQSVPDKTRLFENGQFHDTNLWDIVENVLNSISTREPDCSIDEFLSRKSIPEPARTMVRTFIMGFDAARPDRISAHACKLAEYSAEQMNMDIQSRVAEGYAALVEYFVHQIEAHGGRLVSNATARRVCWQKGSVNVLTAHDGHEERFAANAAIVTLPLGVLKANDVKFEPSLPEKIEAANAMEMGNVVKVVFQFRDSSWEDFGFVIAPAELFPTWWSDTRGPVLTGWAGGPKADALLKLSVTQLEEAALEILGRIIFRGEPASALRKRLVACHYYNWADDPHIRGAYSYIPVNGLDLPKLLAAPVAGTLFFAGEATVTDAQTGTVFGALESGLRAAHEVLDLQGFCMVKAT